MKRYVMLHNDIYENAWVNGVYKSAIGLTFQMSNFYYCLVK